VSVGNFIVFVIKLDVYLVTSFDITHLMDPEAQGNGVDESGNPEVAWWCRILTRVAGSLAGFGE